MKIIVTSASGLLCRKLATEELTGRGYEVVGLYNRNLISVEHEWLFRATNF